MHNEVRKEIFNSKLHVCFFIKSTPPALPHSFIFTLCRLKPPAAQKIFSILFASHIALPPNPPPLNTNIKRLQWRVHSPH